MMCDLMLDCGEFNIFLGHAGIVTEADRFAILPHSHQFYEIHYIDAGQVMSLVNQSEEVIPLSQGTVYFAKPGEVHEQYSLREAPLRLLYIGFDIQAKEAGGNREEARQLIELLNSVGSQQLGAYALRPICQRILAEAASMAPGSKYAIKGAMLELIAHIARLQPAARKQGEAPDRLPMEYKQMMSEALLYIRQHRGHPSALMHLSRRYRMSESHLRRLFKQHNGIAIGEYMRQERIAHAQDLLRSGSSIKEVARQLGYKTPELFSKSFKAVAGCSPLRFKCR